MAAPTIVGAGTSAWATTATNSITINKPTGLQDGDYLVAFLRAQSATGTGDWASSGWSRISFAFSANQTLGRVMGIYALPVPTASAVTATSFTFTYTGTSGRVIGNIAIVRGVDLSAPVVADSGSYSGPSITGTARISGYTDSLGSNSIALGIFAGELVAGNTNAITITSTATVTTLFANDTANDGTSGTSGSRTAMLSVTYPGTTTLPNVDATWGTITGQGAQGVVLKGSAPNVPPVAAFTYSNSGLTVSVDGTTSTDSDGTISSYTWDFGDSNTGTGSTTSHTYAVAGTYTVTLTVTDNSVATNSTTHSVTVTGGLAVVHTYSGYTFGTSHTKTITAPADKNSLVLVLQHQAAGTVTVSDSAGNTWVKRQAAENATPAATGQYKVDIWDCLNIPSASAPTSVTIANATSNLLSSLIYEVSGNMSYSNGGVNVYVPQQATYNAATVTTAVGSLVLSATTYYASSNTATIASPYTLGPVIGLSNSMTSSGYWFATSAGTNTPVWSATGVSNAEATVTAVYASGNISPTAAFTSSVSGLGVTIDGSTSSDGDGTIASYAWNYGDSSTATGVTPATHTYASSGTYTITLTVTDNGGATNTTTHAVFVSSTSGITVRSYTTLTAVGNVDASLTTGAPAIIPPSDLAVGDYLVVGAFWGQGLGNGSFPLPSGFTQLTSTGTASNRAFVVYGRAMTTSADVSAVAGGVTLRESATATRIVAIAAALRGVASFSAAGSLLYNNSTFSNVTFSQPATGDVKFYLTVSNSASPSTSPAHTPVGGVKIVQAMSPSTSGPTYSDSQAALIMGGTGVNFADPVANGGAVGFSFNSVGSNTLPTAAFTTSISGNAVTVDATTSSDTDGTIANYAWDYGDSTTATGVTPAAHTYATGGTYTITLTVTDNGGATNSTTHSVTTAATYGYAGILRTSGGTNYTGNLFYWDGSAKHDFSTTVTKTFTPVTVTQFLSAAHSPWFSAHRGFSYSYPEETLYGYRGATDWGIKAIEVSVQKSASGTFWCFHDPTTDRTTGVSGTISAMTDAQISVLNNSGSTAAGNSTQPARPTAKLVDVLNLYAATHVIIIEDKTYANTTAMLNLMDSYGTSGRPASEIFIWKVQSSSSKTNFYDPAAARGYHRWAYIFDSTMATEFPALPLSGKADMIGMDYNSSDATLSSAIAQCIAAGVMPTGHIIASTTQRDRLLGLGMKGLMMSNKNSVPPWYNIWPN